MELQIKTHNTRISDALRDHIEERARKLDRVNERIIEAKIEVREERGHRDGQRYIAQFTIQTPRSVLRAEEKGTELRSAIDEVIEKMNRQIRRFHDRKVHRGRREAVNLGLLAADQAEELTDEEPDELLPDGAVVRTKRFKILPMDPIEAVEQLELVGHDFYVFFNADTSSMNVLYRRKDGQYGVIEPELA